jgi:hypothetical protein
MTSSSPGPPPNRRRSQRVVLRVPVTLSGTIDQGPFSEDTHTLIISAHGALISLAAKISQGQILRIRSQMYAEEQDCRVIWIGPETEGKNRCGIEFLQPAPNFWHVAFPPADWSPASSEMMAEPEAK